MLTTLFTRLVLTFGERHLPPKTMVEELMIGLLLVVPFGIFLGHLTMRLSCHPPGFCRADVWNTILRLIVADVAMEIILPSVQCLPLDDGPGYSFQTLAQTWGFYCPLSLEESASPSAALTPTSTGLLFATRLLFVCIGAHLGESFAPIALSGGIACGKSSVAHLLQYGTQFGENYSEDEDDDNDEPECVVSDGTVHLVDTDSIAHEILLPDTPDTVYPQILQTFGEEILQDDNGTTTPPLIDRRKLGATIFQDVSLRRKLNSITHPRIIYIMLKRILYGIFWSNQDMTVADVPLLYESGKLRWLFCIHIVVACKPEVQLERLRKRNPDLTLPQCEERIASQMSIFDKAEMADIVLWNDGSYQALQLKVEIIRQELMNRIYGVGLSLLQLLIIIGGSVPLAVMSKLYSMKAEAAAEGNVVS